MKLQAASILLLRQALSKAAKCIDNKNAIAILDNALLTQRDGKFVFVTANADSCLTIPAPLQIIEGRFDKSVVLPIRKLLSFLNTLPADRVITMEICEEAGNPLKLTYCTGTDKNVKSGEVTLTYIDAEDFPTYNIELSSDATHISLPMHLFKGVMSHASRFVANDELRPVMNCLCIDISEDLSQCTFVASSGHVLIRITHSNDPAHGGSNFYRSGSPRKMLVHSGYFKTLSVFDDEADIEIEGDNNLIRFAAGDIEYVAKNVDGKYPNYNSVIPRNNPYYVCFDKKEFLEVLKRVALFSSESSELVRLEHDGMFLDIIAKDIDFSTYANDQVLLTNSQCQQGFSIGFKASNLASTVAAIPANTIRMSLADSSRAAVITADDPAPTVLTLLMPMILDE